MISPLSFISVRSLTFSIYKYKIYYWTYDSTLLDNLITFLIPLQYVSFFVRNCCIAHSFICTFLGNFKSFWKWFTPSFLIITTMLTNNSSIFLQLVKIFVFWLVKWWWWNNNLNNIYVSPFFFVFLVRFNWKVYCWDSFQLPSFLPGSKQPFF